MIATALWVSTDVINATFGFAEAGYWQAHGVSIDTRTLAPGDLFVALSGPNHDGHDHLDAAFRAGAAAALVHRLPSHAPGPLVQVENTALALECLGNAARARSDAKIVAVTGSVGKTGTKEMLRLTLGLQAPTHATLGNLNNQLGAPLSLARMPRNTSYGVFELGMNHAGELTPLTRMVRPHVAVITAIEMAHAAFFADAQAIADAKAEIFLGLEPGGTAILPRDSAQYAYLAAKAQAAGIKKILSFGTDPQADAQLLGFQIEGDATHVSARLGDLPLNYTVGAVGSHWAANSLAVLLAVRALGGNVTQAAAALAQLSPPKGRGNRFDSNGVRVIDDSYNASPASMNAAIAALAATSPAARRIAVLGDMLELGDQAAALHAGLAQALIRWNIDLVFTAGSLMAHLHDVLPVSMRGGHAPSSDQIIAPLLAAVQPGDVVMIKGSAGSRMSRVVQAFGTEKSGAV